MTVVLEHFLAQVEGSRCHSGFPRALTFCFPTLTQNCSFPRMPHRTIPCQVSDGTSPGSSVPAVGGTIADVSSSEISDSLRVLIGDAISPKESEEPEESDSPTEEGKKSKTEKKEKKGLFGGLFGANKVKMKIRVKHQ